MDDYWNSHPLPRPRALTHGLTDNDLRVLQSRDGWTRLRRGHYLAPTLNNRLDPELRHRLLIVATLPLLAAGAVTSHQSAAVLYGLPLWDTPLGQVHVTRADASTGRRTRRSHCHAAPLSDGDIVELAGLPATSLARTVADLARTLTFDKAVVAGDHACRALGMASAEVLASLEPLRGRKGVGRARSVAAFLDGRSESVGESRSRAVLSLMGLPRMDLQFEVSDARGNLVGRADFALPKHGVLGEFDGKVKYGRYLSAGQSAGDAVFEEKRREDRLRDLGWQVVRWTWADLATPQRIVDRFQPAISRGRDMR